MSDVFEKILDGFEEFALITHNTEALNKINMYRDLSKQGLLEDTIKNPVSRVSKLDYQNKPLEWGNREMKISPMELNKKLKAAENSLQLLTEEESRVSVFCASLSDADTVRPEYDYHAVRGRISELQKEIRTIKHCLNVFNTNTYVPDLECTVDELLIIIPQLSSRKKTLKEMALRNKYSRPERAMYTGSSDYTIANYDIAWAKADYALVSDLLSRAQLALDRINSESEIEYPED